MHAESTRRQVATAHRTPALRWLMHFVIAPMICGRHIAVRFFSLALHRFPMHSRAPRSCSACFCCCQAWPEKIGSGRVAGGGGLVSVVLVDGSVSDAISLFCGRDEAVPSSTHGESSAESCSCEGQGYVSPSESLTDACNCVFDCCFV